MDFLWNARLRCRNDLQTRLFKGCILRSYAGIHGTHTHANRYGHEHRRSYFHVRLPCLYLFDRSYFQENHDSHGADWHLSLWFMVIDLSVVSRIPIDLLPISRICRYVLLANHVKNGPSFGQSRRTRPYVRHHGSRRGLMDTIVAFCALGIFSALGSTAFGLRCAILFYAILPGIIGIIMFFLLDPDSKQPSAEEQESVSAHQKAWAGAIQALKNKKIWLVSFNIFLVYSVYCGITYFIPFLKEAYAVPAALVGVYGIINQYGLKMFGGPIGGVLADKVFHSPTKYLRMGFLITAIILICFTWMPYDSMGVWAGVVISLCISACVYTMRAIFFAPMDEIGVPREITGSAMSMASFIGYLPGAFMYVVYGTILDSYAGIGGYQIVFTIMAAFAILGILLSSVIVRQMNTVKKA